jgi:hypothetical protein
MKKLVENQFDENQVNENELEELFGGSGCSHCGCDDICKRVSWADEDSEENVVF